MPDELISNGSLNNFCLTPILSNVLAPLQNTFFKKGGQSSILHTSWKL